MSLNVIEFCSFVEKPLASLIGQNIPVEAVRLSWLIPGTVSGLYRAILKLIAELKQNCFMFEKS